MDNRAAHRPDRTPGTDIHEQPTQRALELTDFDGMRTDPMGSYTGRPMDPHETPVQDADDL